MEFAEEYLRKQLIGVLTRQIKDVWSAGTNNIEIVEQYETEDILDLVFTELKRCGWSLSKVPTEAKSNATSPTPSPASATPSSEVNHLTLHTSSSPAP